MLLRLFLLFTLVPLAELMLLIRIGGLIGLFPTLLLVVATGAAGAWLARAEGLRSWMAVQGELAEGRIPGEELVHGMLVLIAGIVLVTPGVLTDIAGLILLVRPIRQALIRRIRERFTRRLEEGAVAGLGGPSFSFYWMGGRPESGPWATSAPEADARDDTDGEHRDQLTGEDAPRRPRIIEM
jgi:UPF0716 protein FxsA